MKTICRKNILAFMVLAFCFIFVSVLITREATADPDYWISGEVVAGPSEVGTTFRSLPTTQITSYSDEMVTTGWGLGNRGESRYSANLATGSLSASAYARDAYYPLLDYWGNIIGYSLNYGLGIAYVGMKETLYFTIPSGTYDSDLVLTLTGLATGTIATTQNGQASGSFAARLYSSSIAEAIWPATLPEGSASGFQTIPVNMPFSLSAVILPAGEYPMDSYRYAFVYLSIGEGIQLKAAAMESNESALISTANADFSNTLQITTMYVPPGVEWYSASGVFLSELTPIPEPATMILLGSGLIGLAGYGRKKFFKK